MKSNRGGQQQNVFDRLQRAKDDKRKQIELHKTAQAAVQMQRDAQERVAKERATRFAAIDVDAVVASARRLLFWDLERPLASGVHPLNRPTIELVEHFLRVLRREGSTAVLQWPYAQRDLAILHHLAALSVLVTTKERTNNRYTWCEPVRDFRTLYFPWRGPSTGSLLRDLLVIRHELLKHNNLHLTRRVAGASELSAELAAFHNMVGHLTTLKARDSTKPHLAHATLYELFPLFQALGAEDAPPIFRTAVNDLYDRVEYGTGLTKLVDMRRHLLNPKNSPFALFGICPRSDFKTVLAHLTLSASTGREPDVCLIDLGPPGLSRLGPNWEELVSEFIQQLDRQHPGTPALIATHDHFVHSRCEKMLAQRTGAPAEQSRSRVLLRATDEPLTADPAIGAVSPVAFRFHSAAGDGAHAIRCMAEAASAINDLALAGAVRRKIADLRRAMSLPCGLNSASTFLHDTQGQATAEDFLRHRSAAEIIALLRRVHDACEQPPARQLLKTAETAVGRAFDGLEHESPIGGILTELTSALARKASRSLIAFASETDRSLGTFHLLSKLDASTPIKRRLGDDLLRVTTCNDLDGNLASIEASEHRNQWKRVVIVSPSLPQLSIILGRSWLPDEVIVICDREFVQRLATAFRHLCRHPDLAGTDRIGARLATAATAAQAEANVRKVPIVELDIAPHVADAEPEDVIELFDAEDQDGELVELRLASGRTLRARPASTLIRHVTHAEVNPFDRTYARDVQTGFNIVVPDRTFVADARAVLPVKVLAASWLNIYHTTVEGGLATLPGDTLAAKARHVQQRLVAAGARHLTVAAISDWLRIAEHRSVGAEQLRPHAPQKRRDFEAFVAIFHLPQPVAEKIWREGIETLRIDRRKAGFRMAQAFVSVLVDPHGSASRLPQDIKERIAALRRRARDHLDLVTHVRTIAAPAQVTP